MRSNDASSNSYVLSGPDGAAVTLRRRKEFADGRTNDTGTKHKVIVRTTSNRRWSILSASTDHPAEAPPATATHALGLRASEKKLQAVLTTTSQYTKVMRHMAAQNLISADQLHFLSRVVTDPRSDEGAIVRQLVLEFSTATQEDVKGRIFNQILDCIPAFDVRQARWFVAADDDTRLLPGSRKYSSESTISCQPAD
jgi:hypothetical protein